MSVPYDAFRMVDPVPGAGAEFATPLARMWANSGADAKGHDTFLNSFGITQVTLVCSGYIEVLQKTGTYSGFGFTVVSTAPCQWTYCYEGLGVALDRFFNYIPTSSSTTYVGSLWVGWISNGTGASTDTTSSHGWSEESQYHVRHHYLTAGEDGTGFTQTSSGPPALFQSLFYSTDTKLDSSSPVPGLYTSDPAHTLNGAFFTTRSASEEAVGAPSYLTAVVNFSPVSILSTIATGSLYWNVTAVRVRFAVSLE